MVSVIIPVYNAEKYIDECMSGILSQTFKDLEIIIVNDGSTDRSQEMIETYAEEDHRIVLINKENGGPSSARNLGMERAKGEYILFADADDIAMPGLVAHLVQAVRQADVCVAGRIRWDQGKKIRRNERCPDLYGGKIRLRRRLPVYFRVMRGATGRLYKTSVIKNNGITFREDLRYGEDMFFNYKFFKFAGIVSFTSYKGYVYRIHNENSLSQLDTTPFMKQWGNQNRCIIDAFFK